MKAALYKLPVGATSVPLRFTRHRKARRYILRLLPDGIVRVTVPRGGSLEFAAAFARKNIAWIEQQLQRTTSPWKDGTVILFRGNPATIRVAEVAGGFEVELDQWRLSISALDQLRPALEAHLRCAAEQELTARTAELAREQGLEIRRVSVRGQRSRWGSCSARRTISLNWRLIQAPEFVRDYIILHELMHLKEMNHSPRFWEHVAAACPYYKEAERWLRKNSRLLR